MTALTLPRDLLSLLGPDSSSSSSTRTVPHTVMPSTTSSVSQSLKQTITTTQSSDGQWTPTPTQRTDAAESTIVQTVLAATSAVPAASHPADHSSNTWQIIGITIITVLFIATSITLAMFFDRIWRFLKDALCCTSRPILLEEFISDGENQSWDSRTPSPFPSDWNHHKVESLHQAASLSTIRPRELPWNTDTKDWNTLHRHPSRRNDHPPPA